MGAILEELRRLQGFELQLANIRQTREAKVRQVEIHRRQVRQVDEKLQANHQKAREAQVRIDALSLEVAVKEESVNRHRQGLNKAKTNKEYAAVLTALNTEKADNTKVEDDVLKLMEELSTIKAEGATIEAEMAKVSQHAATAEAAVQAFDEQSEAHRSGLQAERDRVAAGINVQTVDIFNRIAQHHDGEAMAPVTMPRPKREEYSCGGCNIQVTLDVVNSLKTRDEVLTCKVCGRILYMDLPAAEPRPVRR